MDLRRECREYFLILGRRRRRRIHPFCGEPIFANPFLRHENIPFCEASYSRIFQTSPFLRPHRFHLPQNLNPPILSEPSHSTHRQIPGTENHHNQPSRGETKHCRIQHDTKPGTTESNPRLNPRAHIANSDFWNMRY